MGKTGYFTHRDFWKHEMGRGHPECPERLDAIEDRLLSSGVGDALERVDVPLATMEQLLLAHTPEHVEHLQSLTQRLVADAPAGGPGHAQIDPDTCMNGFTMLAARRAAGAAIAATDAVIAGKLENAFCAVRPPGHHACRDKAMGFCFFNNVAIVDFDVHHGNGTEDILSDDPRVLMVGIFQHPFYPFSGADHPAPNMCNVPVPAYTRGMDVREIFEAICMPKLEEFKPQMIFVSAGFDAHRDDELGQLGLNENDYYWLTSRIHDVARRFSQGRIVSLLEGGYNLDALASSVETHLRVLAEV